MRQRLANALQLRRDLRHVNHHLQKHPDDAELRARKEKLQDQVIEILFDEVVDLSRDIEGVRASANRNRYVR